MQLFFIMTSLSDSTCKADISMVDKNRSFVGLLLQRFRRLQDFFLQHKVIGRYYIAAMLFLVNIIYAWKYQSMRFNLMYYKYDFNVFSDVIAHWSFTDLKTFYYGLDAVIACFQIPGALLIYIISSQRFLTAAVAVSAILHMVTPLAVNSGTLVFLLVAKELVMAPLLIAALSMWKDWAPPGQQTKFVFLSLSSWVLMDPFFYVCGYLEDIYMEQNGFYILGACGLGWSLLWFLTVSGTPARDPRFTQNDRLYLPTDAHSTDRRWPKLSEVPWKSVFTSVPVYALCLVYFKIGSSYVILSVMQYVFAYKLNKAGNIKEIYFNVLFSIVFAVVLTSSAIITDILSRKFPEMIKVKKDILCGALIIHAILLFGLLLSNLKLQATCFCLSYFIFSTSLAGFLTNGLDLSSQFVSIIGGLIYIFFQLAQCLSSIYLNEMFDFHIKREDTYPFGAFLYYEIGFTIFVAVVFKIWGSFKEQPWSLNILPRAESVHNEGYYLQEHELGSVTQNT